MNLKERLGLPGKPTDPNSGPLVRYGLARNPFPLASQTSGHPRLADEADAEIDKRLEDFLQHYTSQVVVVEGTQGTGKTSLLQYYEQELPSLDEGDGGVFVVHYCPDPEPALDKLLAQVIQSLGPNYLGNLVRKLSVQTDQQLEQAMREVRIPEFRQMLRRLRKQSGAELEVGCTLAIEWLRGLRTLKRHTEALGVNQRLDTTESRIGALRDLVSVSEHVGCLRALFLLLDELEKQEDVSRSSIHIVRYLASLRALIDALPRRFFLVLAITPSARDTYRRYYPALASRLEGSVIRLRGIETLDAAKKLYSFYLQAERQRTREMLDAGARRPEDPIAERQLEEMYKAAAFDAKTAGGGLTARAWLQKLHERLADMERARQ